MNKNPHEFQRQGRYEFTYREILDLRQEIAANVHQSAVHAAKADDLKALAKRETVQADALTLQANTTAKLVADGFEMRDYPCVRFKSYKHGEFIFVRIEDLEVLAREEFRPEDKQRGIGELVWPGDDEGSLSEFMAAYKLQLEEDARKRDLGRDLGGVTVTVTSSSSTADRQQVQDALDNLGAKPKKTPKK